MANLYLGQWEWFTDDAGVAYWRAPGGNSIGVLDLRSLPQCAQAGGSPQGFGLFSYDSPQVNPLLRRNLGADIERETTLVERSAINTALGVTVVETRLHSIIRELLLSSAHYDATGQTRWKPLRGSLRTGFRLELGGFGRILSDPHSETHPGHQATIDVFRADYVRNRDAGVALDALRRWVGYEMRSLYGHMSDTLAQGLLPDP